MLRCHAHACVGMSSPVRLSAASPSAMPTLAWACPRAAAWPSRLGPGSRRTRRQRLPRQKPSRSGNLACQASLTQGDGGCHENQATEACKPDRSNLPRLHAPWSASFRESRTLATPRWRAWKTTAPGATRAVPGVTAPCRDAARGYPAVHPGLFIAAKCRTGILPVLPDTGWKPVLRHPVNNPGLWAYFLPAAFLAAIFLAGFFAAGAFFVPHFFDPQAMIKDLLENCAWSFNPQSRSYS